MTNVTRILVNIITICTANKPSLNAADTASTAASLVSAAMSVDGGDGPAGVFKQPASTESFSASVAAAAGVSNTAGFIPNGSTLSEASTFVAPAAGGCDLADDGGCIAGTFVTPAGGRDVGLGSDAGCLSAGDSDVGGFCRFRHDGGTMSAGRLGGTGLPDLAMAT